MLQVLRPGTRHPDVVLWEEFLLGYGFYNTEVDDRFNKDSVESTKLFQKEHDLVVDGWVGRKTWGKAIELGLDLFEDPEQDKYGPNWPGPTLQIENAKIVGTQERLKVWGKMDYLPAGVQGNPEAIKITNDWAEKNIVTAAIPQITRIEGVLYRGRRTGRGPSTVTVHRLVLDSLLELWKTWEGEGLLSRVRTWAGMWNPRFIRGSRTALSNHAFATAFDINVAGNGLRRTPALLGQRGCVRELVEIANELGWYWGGHFKRKDGMHFEATPLTIR